eukprot:scaffold10406_cov68-Phaeocystis_antarctica.AAC.7
MWIIQPCRLIAVRRTPCPGVECAMKWGVRYGDAVLGQTRLGTTRCHPLASICCHPLASTVASIQAAVDRARRPPRP